MNIGARNDAFSASYDRITQGITSAFCAISAVMFILLRDVQNCDGE
jgi:hypothetical protein